MSRANFKNTIEKEAKKQIAFKQKRIAFIRQLLQEVIKVHLAPKTESIPEAIKFIEEVLISLKQVK